MIGSTTTRSPLEVLTSLPTARMMRRTRGLDGGELDPAVKLAAINVQVRAQMPENRSRSIPHRFDVWLWRVASRMSKSLYKIPAFII